MSSEKFIKSKESGAHFTLSKLEGEWEGKTTVWFEPGKIADESPVTASIRMVLDGRFALIEYKGSFQGQPINGIYIYGHQMTEEKYQSAWIDSFHMGTGIMFSQGEKGEREHIKVLGSYGASEGEPWGWRTELNLEDTDRLVMTAYNIAPRGLEAKATETIFTRKK